MTWRAAAVRHCFLFSQVRITSEAFQDLARPHGWGPAIRLALRGLARCGKRQKGMWWCEALSQSLAGAYGRLCMLVRARYGRGRGASHALLVCSCVMVCGCGSLRAGTPPRACYPCLGGAASWLPRSAAPLRWLSHDLTHPSPALARGVPRLWWLQVVVLYVDMETSIQRQKERAKLASLHNERVMDAGAGQLWCVHMERPAMHKHDPCFLVRTSACAWASTRARTCMCMCMCMHACMHAHTLAYKPLHKWTSMHASHAWLCACKPVREGAIMHAKPRRSQKGACAQCKHPSLPTRAPKGHVSRRGRPSPAEAVQTRAHTHRGGAARSLCTLPRSKEHTAQRSVLR